MEQAGETVRQCRNTVGLGVHSAIANTHTQGHTVKSYPMTMLSNVNDVAHFICSLYCLISFYISVVVYDCVHLGQGKWLG